MQLVFVFLAITMLVITNAITTARLKRGEHDEQLMFHFVIKYRSGLEICRNNQPVNIKLKLSLNFLLYFDFNLYLLL